MIEYFVAVNRHIVACRSYAEASVFYEQFRRINVTRALCSRRLTDAGWVGCEIIRRSWDWVAA